MIPVGTDVFVFHGGKWVSATVRMHKKNGWHLLVTATGKELNRQPAMVRFSPFDIFLGEIDGALATAIWADSRWRMVEFSDDGIDDYSRRMKQAQQRCITAAFWLFSLCGQREALAQLRERHRALSDQ